MKKILIANILICLAFFLLGCIVVSNNNFQSVYAVEKGVYIALGDNNAEGFAYNKKTVNYLKNMFDVYYRDTKYAENYYLKNLPNGDGNFALNETSVQNIYTNLLRKKWQNQISEAVNFAESGYTCKDIVDFINEFYNEDKDICKNPTDKNSVYPTLTNKQVFDYFKASSVITLDIGLNHIVDDFIDLAITYWGFRPNTTITIEEIEQLMSEKISGDVSSSFEFQYRTLIKKLSKLAPNANIYAGNLYNPYSRMIMSKFFELNVSSAISHYYHDLRDKGYNVNFTDQTTADIANVFKLLISGGKDSNGDNYVGMNNVIYNILNEGKKTNSLLHYVDIKSAFDKIPNVNFNYYNDYVNEDIIGMVGQDFYDAMGHPGLDITTFDFEGVMNLLKDRTNPWLTQKGHALVCDVYQQSATIFHPIKPPPNPYVIAGIIGAITLGFVITIIITTKIVKKKRIRFKKNSQF